jgi:hypothetical protein
VNMIETLIIVQGKQIKAIYWDLSVQFWCLNKEVTCHREEISFYQPINGDYNGKLANMLIKYKECGGELWV